MFVLIIVVHYYMVCLITVSIDCKKKIINSAVHIYCRLPKFHHITDVLMDFNWLLVPQRGLSSNLLGTAILMCFDCSIF